MQYPNFSHRPSLRVDVVLNGDPGIRDVFRISLDSNWSAFFEKVRTALCPELTPEFTDSIRDARGAQIFETQVLNDGEILYFCPRGEKLRKPEAHFRNELHQSHHHLSHHHHHHQQGLAIAPIDVGGPVSPQSAPFNLISAAAAAANGQFALPNGLPASSLRQSTTGLAISGDVSLPPMGSYVGLSRPTNPLEPLSFPTPDGQSPPLLQSIPDTPDLKDSIQFPTPEDQSVFKLKSEEQSDEVKEESQLAKNEEAHDEGPKEKEAQSETAVDGQ